MRKLRTTQHILTLTRLPWRDGLGHQFPACVEGHRSPGINPGKSTEIRPHRGSNRGPPLEGATEALQTNWSQARSLIIILRLLQLLKTFFDWLCYGFYFWNCSCIAVGWPWFCQNSKPQVETRKMEEGRVGRTVICLCLWGFFFG